MRKKHKKSLYIVSKLAMVLSMTLLVGCKSKGVANKEDIHNSESKHIMIAAAASMENVMNEIIETYKAVEPNVTVEGVYDSSGKLQVQIEEGLEADIFLSAATKQMDALVEKGFISKESVIPLLENKVVLIGNKIMEHKVKEFSNVLESNSIAIGDPDSVPAGIYAKRIFTNLGLYDDVIKKASLGTNVTEILNWVAEGSAEIGVVYKTDAISNNKVVILEEAKDSLLETPVIYPMAILKISEDNKAVSNFVAYIQEDISKELLEEAGFFVK